MEDEGFVPYSRPRVTIKCIEEYHGDLFTLTVSSSSVACPYVQLTTCRGNSKSGVYAWTPTYCHSQEESCNKRRFSNVEKQ
jgi:hypothetical protein